MYGQTCCSHGVPGLLAASRLSAAAGSAVVAWTPRTDPPGTLMAKPATTPPATKAAAAILKAALLRHQVFGRPAKIEDGGTIIDMQASRQWRNFRPESVPTAA